MSETIRYAVAGMTCDHCVTAVTSELLAVPCIEAVAIDLVPGGVSSVVVTATAPLDASAIGAAVDEAGYALA